jgi:hypothetical protein
MGSPEKSLCDKIITTPGLILRSIKQTRAYLMEDLRIEKQALRELDIRSIKDWIKEAPKDTSIAMLYNTLVDL